MLYVFQKVQLKTIITQILNNKTKTYKMKLFTKLRRKNIYGDMMMVDNNELSCPLVQTNIQGKLFGLIWLTIKTIIK